MNRKEIIIGIAIGIGLFAMIMLTGWVVSQTLFSVL